jgi:hypothetical protein
MTHKTKDCLERPRNKGAKWTNKNIAADEKVEDIKLTTYDARRDRWNGYDASEYKRVVDMYVIPTSSENYDLQLKPILHPRWSVRETWLVCMEAL